MKRRSLAVITIVVCYALPIAAQQTKIHDFSVGMGYIQTMNSSTLPSGLPGVSTSFDYLYLKSTETNTYWGVGVKGQYAFLQNSTAEDWMKEWFLPAFRQAELQVSGVWLKQLPVKVDNLKLYAGAGLSLNAVLHYIEQPPKGYSDFYSNAELNWYLSPDLLLKADYTIKKSCFSAIFSLPVVFAGNFTKFHYAGFDRAKYLKNNIIPNTFTFVHRIFQPTASLSYRYSLFSTPKTAWQLQIKYVYEGLDLDLKTLIERKEQHDFRVGFVCTM